MGRITKIERQNVISTKQKINVVAYARVSTASSEQLISLEAQKAYYENYIKSNNEWEYTGIYYDEGISGTKKDNREGLKSLIQDCERGIVDLVITKSISRFSRKTTDCLEIVRKLMDLNVFIIFEKENINTGSMESEFMLSILSSLAESESVSLSQNTKWSIQKKFQNGTYVISYPPYGYANVEKKMIINPVEAEVIKFVFEEALAGKSTHAIAKKLNKKEIPTRKGGKWHATTINGLMRNEKFIGDAILQKTYTDNNFNRHTNKGDFDKYLLSNHHDAIVSREVFEKVNDILDQRAKEKGNGINTDRYQNRYGFSGKIICDECGSAFKRRTHYKTNSDYIAWCCKQHIEDKESCSMKYITDESVKVAFLTMLNKLIFSHKKILKPLLRSITSVDEKELLIEIENLNNQIEKNKEQKVVLDSLASNGFLDHAMFSSESTILLSEEKNLKSEKSKLLLRISKDKTKVEALEQLIKFVSRSIMLTEYDDEIFINHVEKVIVKSREEIIFLLKCGLQFREGVE